MGKLLKWFFILALMGGISLAIFAYIGPFFGIDFSPERQTLTIPVELNEL